MVLAGLNNNFVVYWPIGHLSEILTGQTVMKETEL